MSKPKRPDYLASPTEYFEANTLLPPFYVVSDTHWFHRNIVKYCNRDMAHNEIMLKRWNATIGPDDVVLHLGDLFMSKRENYIKFEQQVAPHLNGKKYLILGNHDDKKIDYKKLGFTVIKPFRIKYRGYTIEFSHYPSDGLLPGYIRVHGHIHNNGYAHYTKPKRAYRKANINCSVEVIDYTPQVVTDLLDVEVERLG